MAGVVDPDGGVQGLAGTVLADGAAPGADFLIELG